MGLGPAGVGKRESNEPMVNFNPLKHSQLQP